MTDKARQTTDKKLKAIESQMGRIYANSPALKRIEKEYANYMKMVQEKTAPAYKAYKDSGDKDLKKAYMDEVRSLTLESKEYGKIVKKITDAMAQVNREALMIVNNAMNEIYYINYNQVADECKRVGIRVNG